MSRDSDSRSAGHGFADRKGRVSEPTADTQSSPIAAPYSRSAKVMSVVGVAAAVIVVLLVNVLAARHYRRWDMTHAKLYTLSDATVITLRGLERNITVEVLLSPSDPLFGSIKNLLTTYVAQSHRIAVNYVDPDRHPAQFVALQQKYGIEAGRTEDGRVVADAAMVVAGNDRHWFLTVDDLIDLHESDDAITTSRVEQSLTGAIRSVLDGRKPLLCFSYGHGEYSIDDVGPQGIGEFRDRLIKNNYRVTMVVFSSKPANVPRAAHIDDQGHGLSPSDRTHDTDEHAAEESTRQSYESCDALIVAGPSAAFPPDEAAAIDARVRAGMGVVLLINPILDTATQAQADTGLEAIAARFGIGIAKDFVFELDDRSRLARGSGEVFSPRVQKHPVTEGLVGVAMAVESLRPILIRSRSLYALPASGEGEAPATHAATILVTSDKAFGMKDFFAWAQSGREPAATAQDTVGPLAVAMAAQLARVETPKAGDAGHGARIVVVGSANIVFGQNWRDPALRGNAVLAGNIVSWVAAKPPIVDVPAKVTPAATLSITDASIGEISRYVLLFMPAAAALLGVAVYLRRRSVRDRKPANASDRRPAPRKPGDVPTENTDATETPLPSSAAPTDRASQDRQDEQDQQNRPEATTNRSDG